MLIKFIYESTACNMFKSYCKVVIKGYNHLNPIKSIFKNLNLMKKKTLTHLPFIRKPFSNNQYIKIFQPYKNP